VIRKLINVGIADLHVALAPDVLRTVLGSCVGICLYDAQKKIGGLSHIMLPSNSGRTPHPLKYADTAIPLLMKKMAERGVSGKMLRAKVVGGAKMFRVAEESLLGEIGKNNVTVVKEMLNKLGIGIVAEDTGGDHGRTVDFYLDTGEVRVKTLAAEWIEKYI